MKTLITLVVALLISISTFAQQGINYKALLKDDNGSVLADTYMVVQFTIHQGSSSGTIVYQGDHGYTTDSNGLVVLNIGTDGTPSIGVFNEINWGSAQHYLQTSITYNGGTIDFNATQFMAVPYAKHALVADNVFSGDYNDLDNQPTITASSGLETVDEGNGIGWRLKGRDPNLYGDIGFNAVDFSYNDAVVLSILGATGENSIAFGNKTWASGNFSTAMGRFTEATGNFSTAMGSFTQATGEDSTAMGQLTEATGDSSTAMGFNTDATGDFSTAMGRFTQATGGESTAMGLGTEAVGNYSTAMGGFTEATGDFSTAMGGFTEATGEYSTAMGLETISESYVTTSLGRFNVGGGNAESWVLTDPLFEIGNGANYLNRKNALTVLKNGNVITGGSLSIQNASDVTSSWRLETRSNGNLSMYRNGDYRGFFSESTGNYSSISDRRTKKDITAIENGTLNKVMQLNPVSYIMKDQKDTKRNLGLISQEVQDIFPSITTYVEEADLITLSYTELIPILIKALQEQQVIIEAQKAKDVIQDQSIEDLVARLNLIESKSNN
ncbi:tail fiber domain-containing protein [Winogradskyella forsetii]|uniref:tail fiber domain-containing protein n=1 Tax=Winogradskyella forsetii TaxID=2686077 RepID=UPI0015BDB9C0|nr:tail fiber domain-containing protein [Winogradskyella forsetii]